MLRDRIFLFFLVLLSLQSMPFAFVLLRSFFITSKKNTLQVISFSVAMVETERIFATVSSFCEIHVGKQYKTKIII